MELEKNAAALLVIDAIEAVGEDEGRRKEYRITPEGRAAVRVELARLQELTANGEALTRDWA